MMSDSQLTRGASSMLHALLLLCFVTAGAGRNFSNATLSRALSLTPPRGWNSYDSFSWIISEEEFLQNAEYVATNLLKYGYEYVVVDFLWYRKLEPGASVWSSGHDIVDEWGRPLPDPARWPSTAGGKGFKPIADKVHAMGLKFGIHIMRGISTAAVELNTPILCTKDCPEGFEGRSWTAKDITVPGGQCSWMWDCFTSVDTSTAGGIAFINSLYQQYADWEVDMIKNDCVFGVWDLNVPEVMAVGKILISTLTISLTSLILTNLISGMSPETLQFLRAAALMLFRSCILQSLSFTTAAREFEAIERAGRPMLYSLSPGVSATPELAQQVAHLAHMYRVTSDDWDSWNDVLTHFPVARDFAVAGLIGAPGLGGGKSWPDLDMLPLGWLTDPGAPYGPWRSSRLTKHEQTTQITLWGIAKSPLMFGGDLRNLDQWTLNLITQPTVLKMNAHSTHNRELRSSLHSSLPDIGLERCNTPNPSLWKLRRTENGQDELCWARDTMPGYTKGRRELQLTNCLRWRGSTRSIPSLNNSVKNNGLKLGQLRRSTAEAICLDTHKLSRNETDGNVLFSRCDGRASQVWKLIDGNLVSHVDGVCAVVRESSDQWKVWIARGSEGQSYVAFFNLGSERKEVSVTVEEVMNHVSFVDPENAKDSVHQSLAWLDIVRVMPRFSPFLLWDTVMSNFRSGALDVRSVDGSLKWKPPWTCAGLDVWSNTHFIAKITELKASVESHGTVLYELQCSPGKIGQFYSALFWSLVALLFVSLLGLLAFVATRVRFNYGHLSPGENTT